MARDGQRPKTEQLAFDFDEPGGARGDEAQGSAPSPAPSRTGALAPGPLLEAVVDRDNLRAALARVRSNRGAPGADGLTVAQLPGWLVENWPRVREELLSGTYRPRPVRRVEIPKPSGGVRELGIPSVVDRFIQQALLQVLQPIYDPTFSDHSYGFRPGRSAHDAVRAAREYVAEGREWVVDLDLEKFFDRVNHDRLMARLAKDLSDKRLLKLVRGYLESGVLENGVVVRRTEGTPQGSPLSPLLANIVLDELDRELERRGLGFCRYADDCNIFVSSERAAERVMASVSRYVERKLRLRVNREKSAVGLSSQRRFLGFRVVRDETGATVEVAPSSWRRFRSRIRGLTKRYRGIDGETMLSEVRRYLDGWFGYFRLADRPGYWNATDGWIRRRLRCYAWVVWKHPRGRYRRLRQLGVSERAAGVAWLKSPWRAAATPAMHTALNNTRLRSWGHRTWSERAEAYAAV